jgi:hypothetical protein
MKIKALCEECGKEIWLSVPDCLIWQEHIHKIKEKDECK